MHKRRLIKYTAISGLLGCLLLLSGCTHSRALTYTPVIKKQPSKSITLSLDEIQDARQDEQTIAYYRNSYYMPIAFAKSTEPPRKWIASALQTELRNAGYLIKRLDDASQYRISGEVYEVFSDAYLTYAYDVKIELSLFKDRCEVFSKVYKGHRRTLFGPVVFGPFLFGSCDKKFNQCLQSICQEFISDVNAYFEEHDGLVEHEGITELN